MTIAATPAPPYYAVIFTSLRTEGDNGYGKMAVAMETLAAMQPGFLGIESARDGLGITVSYWESLDAIAAWKSNAAHQVAQQRGRDTWYEEFKVRVCRVEREYAFPRNRVIAVRPLARPGNRLQFPHIFPGNTGRVRYNSEEYQRTASPQYPSAPNLKGESMSTTASKPYLNTRNDEASRFLGLPTLIRATGETTNGGLGLIEHWDMPPGWETPYHTHHREDESFYVLEGEVAFVCARKWLKGEAGAFVFGPREIAHGFKVIGNAPARMLILNSPPGFENFVLALSQPASAPPSAPDMQKLVETAARFGIEIHGPLPQMPQDFE